MNLAKRYLLTCLVALLCVVLLPDRVAEARPWYPVLVESWTDPHQPDAGITRLHYTPLPAGQRPWRFCVLLPHLQDVLWHAVSWGLVDEARRLGVGVEIFQAGGYENLERQRRQMSACRNGFDAVLLAAVNTSGLNDLIAEFSGRGIPVIDMINGTSSHDTSARSLGNTTSLGHLTGEQIVRWANASKTTRRLKIGWFPGPAGAEWVAALDQGFRTSLTGKPADILTTRYGDTSIAEQSRLIRDALAEIPDLTVIAGTAVTAQAAAALGREDLIIVASYMSPPLVPLIRRGLVIAAPTGAPVIAARIALDQATRIVEGEEWLRHAAPESIVIDRNSLSTIPTDWYAMPAGSRLTLSVPPEVQ